MYQDIFSMCQEQMYANWKTLFIRAQATNKMVNTQVKLFLFRTSTFGQMEAPTHSVSLPKNHTKYKLQCH